MKSIIVFCFLVIVAECIAVDNATYATGEISNGTMIDPESYNESKFIDHQYGNDPCFHIPKDHPEYFKRRCNYNGPKFIDHQYADDSCLYLSKDHPDYIKKRCGFEDDYYYVCLHDKPRSIEPLSLNSLCTPTPEDYVPCFWRKGLNEILEAFGCRFRFQEFPDQDGNKTNFCIAKQEVKEKLRSCAHNIKKIGLKYYNVKDYWKTQFVNDKKRQPKFNLKLAEFMNESCLYLSPKNLDYFEKCSPEENDDSIVCGHHKEGYGSANFLCSTTKRDTVYCTTRKAINAYLDAYGCGMRIRAGNNYNYCLDAVEFFEKRAKTCKKYNMKKEYHRAKRRLQYNDFTYDKNDPDYTFYKVEYRDEICNNLPPQHPDYIKKCSQDDTLFSFICIYEGNLEGSLQERCTKRTKPICIRVNEFNGFLREFRCGFSFKGKVGTVYTQARCMGRAEFNEKMRYCRYVYEDAMPEHYNDFVKLVS